jgi:predicted nuclease with RNAse H fold
VPHLPLKSSTPRRWAGVDVGGSRKGFHIAVIENDRVVLGGKRVLGVHDAVEQLRRERPVLVAIDAPRRAALDEQRSRECERTFVRAGICALRYTPDLRSINGSQYYEWIRRGFALYAALERVGLRAIECFPTASWTIWAGQKGLASRARWSSKALGDLHLDGVPSRLGQDARDAIGAAMTARCHAEGRGHAFGDLVVPAPTTPGRGDISRA